MAHRIVSANELEAHPVSEWGHLDVEGHFRPVGEALGVSAFGLNQLELAPEANGPIHDHFIFLSPEAERQMVAGAEGLAWVGIGCKPGAYESP
jgi:hypothetical protein